MSPPFHRVSISGCRAPHRHQGSVSTTETCHHASPLGETHHVALEITIPSALASATHLTKLFKVWGRRNPGQFSPKDVGTWQELGNATPRLNCEIQQYKISLKCQVDKTSLAFRTLCRNLVMLFFIILQLCFVSPAEA